MPTTVPQYLHLHLFKHTMRNASRLRLRAHTLKVEAAAWLEGYSRVCDQCSGEDVNMFRARCMLFILPRPGNIPPFRVNLVLRTYQQPNPFCCNRSTTNFLYFPFSAQKLFLFLSVLLDLFVDGRDRSAADQPNYLAEGHPRL